ncbi:MAG TPA: molybdopterin-dependent oxidoreductase [Thermoanaerobaculia bacterium]|nr:molybdopterin-dependent oxidoreductase [Thermoanaerobaculia bacterium]
MNGEPPPDVHGAPVRLIVPGWAGDHWMKWLRRLSPQTDAQKGFYLDVAYRYRAPRRVQAWALPSLNEKQWAASVTKMAGWGADVPEAKRDELVAYLAKNFGPDNDRFQPVVTRPAGR